VQLADVSRFGPWREFKVNLCGAIARDDPAALHKPIFFEAFRRNFAAGTGE
jgi:hypothetical protein